MGKPLVCETVHGTCVAIDGAGVLLRGASGAGKSDLALRLIDEGAQLVADDRVRLRVDGRGLIASAPDAIVGVLEVNGVGLARIAGARLAREAPLALICDLGTGATERLPAPGFETVMGVDVPRLGMDPFAPSAPAKLRLAAGRGPGSIMEIP